MELEDIEIGKVYYEGIGKAPYYMKQVLDKVNSDGTIDSNGVKRQTVISSVGRWNGTKEQAITHMIEYWLTFANTDMSTKHEFYQKFVIEMGDYVKNNHPEYLI